MLNNLSKVIYLGSNRTHGRVEIFKSSRLGLFFNSLGKRCHRTDREDHAGVTHQGGIHERIISVIM